MKDLDMDLNVRGFEIKVNVQYTFETGGSNFWGSDEPAWCDINFYTITSRKTGRPVSERLRKYLTTEHSDWLYREVEIAENY